LEDGRPTDVNELEDDPTDKPTLEPLIPKPEPPVDLNVSRLISFSMYQIKEPI